MLTDYFLDGRLTPFPLPKLSSSDRPRIEYQDQGANSLNTGAMASVTTICETIEQKLNLNTLGEPRQTG